MAEKMLLLPREGGGAFFQPFFKVIFEYTCFVPQYSLTLTARYFLIQEHALVGQLPSLVRLAFAPFLL
jgi:hypothetical protein